MVFRKWWKSVPTEEHKQAQVAFDFILLFYKELICCNRWYQVSLRLLRLHQLVSVRPLQKTEKCNLFDLTTYFFFLVHKLTRSYQNQTTFLTNRPVSAVIGFSKLYCSRSYIRNRLSQQKGGWYHIFCQYCYRWCVLLSSLATKPPVVHTRSYREDEHMLTAKSPWTCDWPPLPRAVYFTHPLWIMVCFEQMLTMSCVNEERAPRGNGPQTELPISQTWPSTLS